MENRNCSISGCDQPALEVSQWDKQDLALCEFHIKSKTDSSSARSSLNMTEFSSMTCETKNYTFSPLSEYLPLVCGFGSEVYLFTCNSIDIPLVEEYRQAFSDLCKTMASKIVKMRPAENEKLKLKFNKFVNACLQIVYNLNVDIDELGGEIDKAYNEFYGKVTDLNIDSINKFLNDAQQLYEMKDKTRVKLVFTAILEDEKQKFIQIFMSEPVIDMSKFESEFSSYFSNFITNKSQDISKSLRAFEVAITQKKKSLKEHYESEIFTILLNYFSQLVYCRVGIFSCKITENFSVPTNTQLNWEMVSSFFLQKTECSISVPIEISRSELLIPLHLNSNSYILYYSGLGSPTVVQTFRFKEYQIAGGSFVDRIFVYKKLDDKVHEYSLINFKMQLKKSYDTITKGKERVTSIIFIKESERLLFVVDYKQVYMKILNSSVRADLKNDEKDGGVLDLAYYKEKKLVCVKFQNLLKLYNIHLQIIGCYDVIGNSIATVYSLNENGYAICLRDNLIVEVTFNGIQKNFERNSLQVIPNQAIKSCQWSMSKDNINLMKNSSKYIGTVNKKFKTPDSYKEIFNESYRDKVVPRFIVIEEEKNFGSNVGGFKRELNMSPNKVNTGENLELKNIMPPAIPKIPNVPVNLSQNSSNSMLSNPFLGPPKIPLVPGNEPQLPPKIPLIPANLPQVPPKIPFAPGNGPQVPQIPLIPANLPQLPPKIPFAPGNGPQVPQIPLVPGNGPQVPPKIPLVPGNEPQFPPKIPLVPGNEPQFPPKIPLIPGNGPQGPPKIPEIPQTLPMLPQGPPSNIPKIPSNTPSNPPYIPAGMPQGPPKIPLIPPKPPQNSTPPMNQEPLHQFSFPPSIPEIPNKHPNPLPNMPNPIPFMPNLISPNLNKVDLPSLPQMTLNNSNMPFNLNQPPPIPKLPSGHSGPVGIPNLPGLENNFLESSSLDRIKIAPMPPQIPQFPNSFVGNPILPPNLPSLYQGPPARPEKVMSQDFTELRPNNE